MKRLSWKYIAGLVDGEGCIDMQGYTDKRDGTFYCRPRLRIVMSGPGGQMIVEMLKANHGGCYEARDFDNPRWLKPYGWGLTGKTDLRKFLQNIVNHLIIKKEQARLCIWWIDNIGGKHVTQEVRRLIVGELKAMKVDPHRLSEVAAEKFIPLMR